MSSPNPADNLAAAAALAPKIRAITDEILVRNIDRGDEAKAFWLGLVCGHPVFFLGPYGVNKTSLIQQLAERIDGVEFDERLMSMIRSYVELFVEKTLLVERQVTPEEKETLVREILGRAMKAHVFFGDEFFKNGESNPAMNELIDFALAGVLRHEGKKVKAALLLFLAAGNELPDPDGSLGAIWSRMILRLDVRPLDTVGKRRLVRARLAKYQGGSTTSKGGNTKVSMADVVFLRLARPHVQISDSIIDTVLQVYQDLMNQNDGEFNWLWSDDRRFGRVFDVLQAHALLQGRTQVTSEDLIVLKWLLWNTPEQIPAVETVVDPLCRTPFGECREQVDMLLAAGGIVDQVCAGSTPGQGPAVNAIQQINTCKTSLVAKLGTLTGLEAAKVQSWIIALQGLSGMVASAVGGSIDSAAAQAAYNGLKSALS